jgi:hypothetical protein
MPRIDATTKKIIQRCQRSPSFFLNSFGKIQHPKLGIIPFKLFSYQQRCLSEFLKHRFTIFKKTRQSGISTVSGSFALWYAMFFNQKTILIVSKRDLDAMDFLRKNVKTIHDNLPDWMRELWPRTIDNEHEVGFGNGSRIISLTSSKDTLRSHASSLNIIDEAAFIPDMDQMWSAGASTLQHGGNCIVISTVKGIGNWYWQTWTDAESNLNDFKPITINWWDMDWKLSFVDELSGKDVLIAPTAGIRKCETPEDVEKYGPYWSKWLEDQYRQLTQRGDSSKYRQEVLAEFLGTGNTVLSRQALLHTQSSIYQHNNEHKTVSKVDYVNPSTNERAILDFENRLWVWKLPVRGATPHTYCVGVDTSSGDANDYSTIEVMDVTEQEQVAELQIKVLPRVFATMADYIGRWYNNAFMVVERTGIGVTICQELFENLMYQNLYRRPKKNSYYKESKYGDIGFNTSTTTKPMLNKTLTDNVGEDGFILKSSRLYKELSIYVHLKGGRTGAEPGKGNTDDLVMALALVFIGMNHSTPTDGGLIPIRSVEIRPELHDPDVNQKLQGYAAANGLLMPVTVASNDNKQLTISQELAKFTNQLGARAMGEMVVPQKHAIRYRRK